MDSANNENVWMKLLLHLHPKKVNEESIKYNRTFGLGGICALLFLILSITGILLRFKYVPTVSNAYNSIVILQDQYIFGNLLRNIHHWSAVLLIISSFLHLIRVLYSQSIYFERRKNWIYGLLLFFLVIVFNFTGYLLPWDQLSFWAVTIVTEMLEYIPIVGNTISNAIRGGEIVSENTLFIFYNLHTGLLPILFIVFMSIHFWLVRKAKGVTVNPVREIKMVDTHPNLVHKEIIVGLGLIAFVLLLSLLIDAPLLDKANPDVSPNPSKAPWYFMGFQELLLHIHPSFAVFVIPILVIFIFIRISYIKNKNIKIGFWFNSEIGKRLVLSSIIFSFFFTLVLILINEYFLNNGKGINTFPLLISTGFFQFLLYVLPLSIFYFYIKKRIKPEQVEIRMAMLSIILTSYLVMSIIGIWLRGDGMQLIFSIG